MQVGGCTVACIFVFLCSARIVLIFEDFHCRNDNRSGTAPARMAINPLQRNVFYHFDLGTSNAKKRL